MGERARIHPEQALVAGVLDLDYLLIAEPVTAFPRLRSCERLRLSGSTDAG